MKKMYLLFTLWAGCMGLGYAQSASSRLSVGLTFYPNQTIKSSYTAIIQDYTDGSSSATEESKLAFAFGAELGYQIANHWELQAGLLFDDKGYKIEEEYNRTSIGTGKEVHNVHINYLGVPLSVLYKIGKKRNHFFIGTGISTDFFLNTSGYEQESSYIENNFRAVGFSHIISFGGEWALHDKVRLSVEPKIRYALSEYSQNIFKPGAMGVSLGIAYAL